MEYLNTGTNLLSGSFSTLVTASASDKLLIKSIHCTNITGSNAEVTIKWVDSSNSNSEYFLSKDVVIPNASSFQPIDGTLVLDSNDSLLATTSISGSINTTVSYVSVPNS
jgi:hypothetical protein